MADVYLEKAKTLTNKRSWKIIDWITGDDSSQRKEEAGTLYMKAGHAYKALRQYDQALEAFIQASICFNYCGSWDYKDSLNQIISMQKKVDPSRLTGYYQQLIQHLEEEGNFTAVAKVYRDLAEQYVTEYRRKEAVEAYLHAAETYELEDGKFSAFLCRREAATILAWDGKFAEAATLYLSLAGENNYLAEEAVLRAGLCQLASGDKVAALKVLAMFRDLYAGKRFMIFLEQIINAEDPVQFTDYVAEYDSLNSIDPWETRILLVIKKRLGQNQDHQDLT
ncbi:MAG: soluble NSF attachment family protein [Nitrososphaerales archaeon]